MTILAQLSDLHLHADARRPRRRARPPRPPSRRVLDLRPAPDAVLVSGDLGERGDPAEYALARELLAPLPMPVHVLAGNHDDHEALSEAFGTPVRYTAASGRWRSWPATPRCPGAWRDGSTSSGSRPSSRRRAAGRW